MIVRCKQVIVAEIPAIRLKVIVVSAKGACWSTDVVRLHAEENINLSFLDNIVGCHFILQNTGMFWSDYTTGELLYLV